MKKSSIPHSNNRLPGETTVSSSPIKKPLITGYRNYTKEKIITTFEKLLPAAFVADTISGVLLEPASRN